MALAWKHQLMILLSIATCCYSEDRSPSKAILRALGCFNRQDIYSKCEDDYRLNAQGVINVPRTSTKAYCEGPCMGETELVLDCVDNILSTFLFYNGATTRNVRDTIHTACGRDGNRGDFDVFDRIYGNNYGKSRRLSVPWATLAMAMANCALVLLSLR